MLSKLLNRKGDDAHRTNLVVDIADERKPFRDAAAMILGPEADRVFEAWAKIDPSMHRLLLQTAKKMEMHEEVLALGLWRLSAGGRRPELDLDADWMQIIFTAARQAGLSEAALPIYNMLRNQKKGADNRLLDMAFLHADSGAPDQAFKLLQRAQPSAQRQQLMLETLLERGTPDVGLMLATLLRDLPTCTKKRLWQIRPLIGRSKLLARDDRLLHFIVETCHDQALLFALACAVDAGKIGDIDRSVLARITDDKPFWSALVGRKPTDARFRSMAELSALYLRAGLGGVGMTEIDQPFGSAGPLPYLTSSSLIQAPKDRKVAIILCAYNAQSTIEYALRSVCQQGHSNLSIIVVDDCSPEPLQLDPNWFMGRDVTLHRNKVNLGPYLSRNVGISLTDADVISFHDADDWMHPDKISHQLSELERTDAVAHYGTVVRIRPDGIITPENNGQFLGDGPITGMFRREAFARAGRFAAVRTRGDIEYRRRLSNLLGENAVISSTVPYVLALDWESNSKQMTKRWANWQNIRDFIKHSGNVRLLERFTENPEGVHEVINQTMPISLKIHYKEI